MRPMTPAHASIASLSVVFPDDAWPTVAKLRRSPAEGAAINQTRSCSKDASNSPRAQAKISGSHHADRIRHDQQTRAEARTGIWIARFLKKCDTTSDERKW
jgi:hypothetical protein